MKTFAVSAIMGAVALASYKGGHIHNANKGAPNVHTPLVPANALPSQWLWNNVDGINYITNIRN